MASQYSTILTSDSSTTVNQYDVIKYSDYESLKTKYETALSNYNAMYSKYNTLYEQSYIYFNPGINLRVEGGGIIFFDWKYGFTGATTTGSEGCAVAADTTSDLGDYYYDVSSRTVKCTRVGAKHRFYVVSESDLTSSTVKWDTSNTYSGPYRLDVVTSTGFGSGKSNTTTLCNNLTDTNSFWPTVKTARATNPAGHDLVSNDGALDTRWFVPSKDELYVLNAMQYKDSNYRPSGIPQLSKRYASKTLSIRYWSSSQHLKSYSDGSYWTYVWVGGLSSGAMSQFQSDFGNYVRLCRTF